MIHRTVGLGAGGHAKVMIEILQQQPEYELVGLLDPSPDLLGQRLLGVPIVGNDDDLPTLIDEGVTHFFVGLGGTGNVLPRKRLYEMGCANGLAPANAIHPKAILSSYATYGAGLVLCAGAIVGADVRLGNDVMVNTGAIVEHDCQVGDHVHIATGSQLASTVVVASEAHIGAGATVRQCIQIGQRAIVGAGSVVVKDVLPETVVVGVPARVLR